MTEYQIDQAMECAESKGWVVPYLKERHWATLTEQGMAAQTAINPDMNPPSFRFRLKALEVIRVLAELARNGMDFINPIDIRHGFADFVLPFSETDFQEIVRELSRWGGIIFRGDRYRLMQFAGNEFGRKLRDEMFAEIQAGRRSLVHVEREQGSIRLSAIVPQLDADNDAVHNEPIPSREQPVAAPSLLISKDQDYKLRRPTHWGTRACCLFSLLYLLGLFAIGIYGKVDYESIKNNLVSNVIWVGGIFVGACWLVLGCHWIATRRLKQRQQAIKA